MCTQYLVKIRVTTTASTRGEKKIQFINCMIHWVSVKESKSREILYIMLRLNLVCEMNARHIDIYKVSCAIWIWIHAAHNVHSLQLSTFNLSQQKTYDSTTSTTHSWVQPKHRKIPHTERLSFEKEERERERLWV